MPTITIRDIPEEAHAALKVMAADAHRGGRRSVEGLARTLLVDATRRRGPGLGTQLAAVGRQFQSSLAEAGESMGREEIEPVQAHR